MESEPAPVGHMRQANGQCWEYGDPNHLFKDTYGEAQRQDESGHVEEGCGLDTVSEEPPEYPTDGSQKEIVHAPGCHQKPERDGNVAVPGVDAYPLLQGKQQAQQGKCSHEDDGVQKRRNGSTFNRCQQVQW